MRQLPPELHIGDRKCYTYDLIEKSNIEKGNYCLQYIWLEVFHKHQSYCWHSIQMIKVFGILLAFGKFACSFAFLNGCFPYSGWNTWMGVVFWSVWFSCRLLKREELGSQMKRKEIRSKPENWKTIESILLSLLRLFNFQLRISKMAGAVVKYFKTDNQEVNKKIQIAKTCL